MQAADGGTLLPRLDTHVSKPGTICIKLANSISYIRVMQQNKPSTNAARAYQMFSCSRSPIPLYWLRFPTIICINDIHTTNDCAVCKSTCSSVCVHLHVLADKHKTRSKVVAKVCSSAQSRYGRSGDMSAMASRAALCLPTFRNCG